MGDNCGEYILQWEGHARHVTERFSGLLARQSLVDVTLICEEQRIRVHRLVLASCSLYFEEMLEQDLGQEPTILLNDLNFEVLKAMVEFMYCGETSVSKEHLEPLLNAARVFQVKELACIAENMMEPQETVKRQQNDTDVPAESNDYSLFSDNEGEQTSMWNKKIERNEFYENELEKKSNTNDFPQTQTPMSLKELAARNVLKFYKEIPNGLKFYLKNINSGNETDNEFATVVNEKCINFLNIGKNFNECFKRSETLPNDNLSSERKEVTRNVDKFLKVYTHKRRKSTGGIEKQFVKMINDLPEILITDNCIDLIEEPSKNETELETDYILCLSKVNNAESNPDLVDNEASEDDVFYANNRVNLNKKTRQMKEIFSNDNGIIRNENTSEIICKSNSFCAPTLRRSVRLSHQENEDSTNNNNTVQDVKDFRKESLKRKNKESELYCQSDENRATTNSTTKCLDRPRSLRSNSNGNKFIERRGIKTRLSFSKGGNNRDEQKSRGNNKTVNVEPCQSFSNKFNTIATVSRALWGDMSDCLENSENNVEFSDYSSSKEIPFAVGLLPLRAALERMQAMPDYQPRKTRSSVTPFRQEFKGFKRKNVSSNGMDSNNCNVSKRQSTNNSYINNNNNNNNINNNHDDDYNHTNNDNNNNNNSNLTGNTVCHVRITTSHSQTIRSRRKLINEEVDAAATISPTNIVNRQ